MQKLISSRVLVFHTLRKADQSNRRIPDSLKLEQTILRKIFRRNIDACVPFIFFEIEVGRILAVTFPHTQNCCKKEKSRCQMVAYFKVQCFIYANVYCGILNIPINKTSRSILIGPLKKSLFCRDRQSIRKIKIEIFQTIEQHKMIHASTRHFSKIRFAVRLVGQHDNIKT